MKTKSRTVVFYKKEKKDYFRSKWVLKGELWIKTGALLFFIFSVPGETKFEIRLSLVFFSGDKTKYFATMRILVLFTGLTVVSANRRYEEPQRTEILGPKYNDEERYGIGSPLGDVGDGDKAISGNEKTGRDKRECSGPSDICRLSNN